MRWSALHEQEQEQETEAEARIALKRCTIDHTKCAVRSAPEEGAIGLSGQRTDTAPIAANSVRTTAARVTIAATTVGIDHEDFKDSVHAP